MSDSAVVLFEDVCFKYAPDADNAVDHVSFSIQKGEFISILGHNGSGKSTLAKLINALFLPVEGRVTVLGMDTRDEKKIWDIRQHAGMIFQNPDNQLVATLVREDVAFGLENLGVPHDEMILRIDEALDMVGMKEYESFAPHLLSGGQKQRVAIAGVLAMRPDILISDESTAMLDPQGRKEVMDTVRRLNHEQGITVLWITHFMEEAAASDRVLIMHDGHIQRHGTPRDIFADTQAMKALHLDSPPMTELSKKLIARGYPLREGILTVEEMAEEVARCLLN